MDARTRHELKQNELAEVLGRLRHLNDPRIRQALVAVGVVIVVVLAFFAWKSSRRSAQEQSWQALQDLITSAEGGDAASVEQARTGLRDLIAKGGDAVVLGFARLQLASLRVGDALAQPEQRPAGFEEAVKLLGEVRSAPDTPPVLFASASFALAGAYESLREFDKARELYTALANDAKFEGMVYKGMAAERLASLEDVKAAVAFTPGGPPATVEPPSEAGAAPQVSGLPPGMTMQPSGAPPGMDAEALKRMMAERQGSPPAGAGQPATPAPAQPPPAQPPAPSGTPQSP
jgi:hypothetical protein